MNDNPKLQASERALRQMEQIRKEHFVLTYQKTWQWFQRRDRRRYFFLGWCAGMLSLLLALLIAKAEACGEASPPDTTIEQIKVRTI